MVEKLNDIKFHISAHNGEKLVYGSTVLDTASIDTILALNDELFDDNTQFEVIATVDGKDVFVSGKFDRVDIDPFLDAAEFAVEKIIQ